MIVATRSITLAVASSKIFEPIFVRRPSARRPGTVVPTGRQQLSQPKNGDVDAIRSLGLISVTGGQGEAAISQKFEMGTEGVDESEVHGTAFLGVKRQNSGDNVG